MRLLWVVCFSALPLICLVDARSFNGDIDLSVELLMDQLHSRIKRSTDELVFVEVEKASASRTRRSTEDGIELAIERFHPIDLDIKVVGLTRRKRDTESHPMRGYCRVEGGHSVPLGTPFSIHKDGKNWVCQCPTAESNTGKEAFAVGHSTASVKCRAAKYECKGPNGETTEEGTSFKVTLQGNSFECECPTGANTSDVQAACVPSAFIDHVFCVTGDQRKVPAGGFFHDLNEHGKKLTCVCPVHLKKGDEKTKVACTKDDVIRDGKPHDCLAPTGETLHPGQEISFSSKGANVSCTCPANPTQKDLNKKSSPCHASMEAYQGFSCKLPDGRTFRAGETFAFQQEHKLLSCVCPEHVPVAMAPKGLGSEGVLFNVKCQHAGAD